MIFELICVVCGATVWLPGQEDPDTNAIIELHEGEWPAETCEHLVQGGEYRIGRSEYPDDELLEGEI